MLYALFDVSGYPLFEAKLGDRLLGDKLSDLSDEELKEIAEDRLNLQTGALATWNVHRCNLDEGELTIMVVPPEVG